MNKLITEAEGAKIESEDKVTEGIKDINTDENLVFKKINELSDKEKLILAECIIKHFEYSNVRGMQKAFNIFGGNG